MGNVNIADFFRTEVTKSQSILNFTEFYFPIFWGIIAGTSTERFVREECEAEEEIRSLGKPDDFYDVKKVDACIQKKLGFKENPGIVKDPVGNRTYTS